MRGKSRPSARLRAEIKQSARDNDEVDHEEVLEMLKEEEGSKNEEKKGSLADLLKAWLLGSGTLLALAFLIGGPIWILLNYPGMVIWAFVGLVKIVIGLIVFIILPLFIGVGILEKRES